MLEVMWKKRTNYFYIFGGKDEGSQQLVQGITAAGAFFDEVAPVSYTHLDVYKRQVQPPNRV